MVVRCEAKGDRDDSLDHKVRCLDVGDRNWGLVNVQNGCTLEAVLNNTALLAVR